MTNKPNASKSGWPTSRVGPIPSASAESVFTFTTTKVEIIKSINVQYAADSNAATRSMKILVEDSLADTLGGSGDFADIILNKTVNCHAATYENEVTPVNKTQTLPDIGEFFSKIFPIELPIGTITIRTITQNGQVGDQLSALSIILEEFIPSVGSS
jgi:hypothetical protein